MPDSLRLNLQALEEDEDWALFDDIQGGVDVASMVIDDDPTDLDWIPENLKERVQVRRRVKGAQNLRFLLSSNVDISCS
jgi:hypothetical protein